MLAMGNAAVHSMTGFGKGTAPYGAGHVTAEVLTVNGRYLDITVRGLREFGDLELQVRRRVAERLARGTVTVTVAASAAALSPKRVTVNETLARDFERAFDRLRTVLGLKGSLPLETLALRPEFIIIEEETSADEDFKEATLTALDGALVEVLAARAGEGARLVAQVNSKIVSLRNLYGEIAARAPAVVAGYRERLRANLSEVRPGFGVDENRLAEEVALFAERCDITEELNRSEVHLAAFAAALGAGGRIGRRLDFLVVELNREANTIAAKAQDGVIAAKVVEIKDLLEQIREQVQNIE